MKIKVTRSFIVSFMTLCLLVAPAVVHAHPAVTLLDRNGNPIKDQLDPNDTIQAANGSVYMRGPAYSPKKTCGA